MPSDSVEIPWPVPTGIACGVIISLAISLTNILTDAQGHAVLVAAIATPYLAFALLDGSTRSVALETTVLVAFTTAAFIVFDATAWVVAAVLASHAAWDVAHERFRITDRVGDYPVWCAALDLSAAGTLIAVSAL